MARRKRRRDEERARLLQEAIENQWWQRAVYHTAFQMAMDHKTPSLWRDYWRAAVEKIHNEHGQVLFGEMATAKGWREFCVHIPR